jgi:hypothetical protein
MTAPDPRSARDRPARARENQPDPLLLAVGWSVLWGIVLGLWIVAPAVVQSHHVRPQTATQWVLVVAALAGTFTLIGAVLGFIGSFFVRLGERATIGSFTHRPWAYGLVTPFVLSIGYAMQALLIHWGSFGSLRGSGLYRSDAIVVGAACTMGMLVAAVLYRHLAPSGRTASWLAWSLLLAATAGGVALAARSPQLPEAPSTDALASSTAPNLEAPLLFVGIDGATWRVLEPAMANGSAPTLRRLVERGMAGTVEALWPPYWSGAAWSAIVTGLPREVTGVYEDLAADAPGLPVFQVPIRSTTILNPVYSVRAAYRAAGLVRFMPPPRTLLRGTPVWQRLHQAGVATAVVRWRFTFPPEDQAGIVVSDFVGGDQWEGMGVRRPDPRTAVAPARLADRLLASFDSSKPSDPSLFSRLLPGARPGKPADALGDPIEELALASDIDNRTFEVSETILRLKPDLGFLAVYIGGLDSVEHAFWQYRFPEDFSNRPAGADVERLGPVMDRYVRYVDERLGRLLALYDREPNVVIVSDHGHGPTTVASKWRGWHTKHGVFVGSGPSVARRAEPVDVSYYDIVPTLLELKGFRPQKTLAGHPLIATESVGKQQAQSD